MSGGRKARTLEENIMANLFVGDGCWMICKNARYKPVPKKVKA